MMPGVKRKSALALIFRAIDLAEIRGHPNPLRGAAGARAGLASTVNNLAESVA